MKLYIIVEEFGNGKPPALHIHNTLKFGSDTCHTIIAENNGGQGYDNLSLKDACEMYNREGTDYFIHFIEENLNG